ncbi:MAG: homoserine acetyltransferase [Methanosphaera sp. rholeuAM270]|nr:MAG: homoserine acetyltransferase [Methanosphaera sp. rholeuAM270]
MQIEDIKAEHYTLKNFTFNNGVILENLDVEYITFGTPKYDEEGHINNAILYFHGTSGNFSSIKRISEAIGENLAFDIEKFFFISLSTLGTPGSSSPSTTKLFNNYPEYSILDMVNFNKRFLKEKFNIVKPLGLIGNSMGGFEALTWAAEYPDSITFIISLVSSYKVGGQNYVLGKLMNDIIESDPNFNNPQEELKRSLKLSSKAMYSFGLSRNYYMDLTNDEIDEYMDEFAQEDSEENVYDAYYRNLASIKYDLTDKVSNIKVPTLIIAIEEDQYFPPELDAIPMHALIGDSRLVIYNSYLGHIGSSQLNKIKDELEDFMLNFK